MSTTLLSLALLCAAAAPVETSEAPETLLYVRTVPRGAKVFLNGKELGTSPGLFAVEPGVGKITVVLEGHDPSGEDVEILATRVTRVVLEFKRRKEVSESISGKDVGASVLEAVKTISTCAEGDPRVAAALASLEGLDQALVVAETAKSLTSEQAPIRRAAVYILWRGKFDSVQSAVPALLKLCKHEEEFTRGMAALALGANKVADGYDALADMTANDRNGYARRCAAYALGNLGNRDAIPVLKKALEDSDPLVRNNARAALAILGVEVEAKAEPAVTAPASILESLEKPPEGTGEQRELLMFGLVIEQSLNAPEKRVAELLDLDTGRRATMKDFGNNDRETHGWIREHAMDVLGAREGGGVGILLFDVAVWENPSIRWDKITAAEVREHQPLDQTEPKTITGLYETDLSKLPRTCVFRTREGGMGVLQLVGPGPDGDPQGVKIRYKLVRAETQEPTAGKPAATVRTCSMHPQVKLPRPGKCPICAMDLIPLGKTLPSRPTTESPAAPRRQRHFVRLVVGKDSMTFEGKKTTWEQLPALLEKVPSREHTVLEIAMATDELTHKQWNDAVGRAGTLARRHGFEYLSLVGVHPLGSKGTPTQTVPADKARSNKEPADKAHLPDADSPATNSISNPGGR